MPMMCRTTTSLPKWPARLVTSSEAWVSPTSVPRSAAIAAFRLVQRDVQVFQQDVQRRLAIQLGHQVVVRARDGARGRDRLAALRHAREQGDLLGEGDAGEAAAEHAAGLAVALQVAIAADGELHDVAAAGREPAEQVAGGRCGPTVPRSVRRRRACLHRHAPAPCAA
jgi:hypothetical protein